MKGRKGIEGTQSTGTPASLRAAVVGLGDICGQHLDAVDALEGVDLVGVCDIDLAKAEAVGARLGVPAFDSHRELLAAVRPDALHVCLPHDLHEPVALDALEAGVDVLLEKPVAHTVACGEAVAAAAARTGRTVGVCFQNRYNVTSRALHEALRDPDVGDVVGARAGMWWHRTPEYYAASPWRGTWAGSGGGVLVNQAIHTIDLLCWLLGDPIEVDGHAGARALADVIEVEDTAELRLRHPGGATSTLFATNTHVVNAPVMLEVTTTRGILRLDDGVLTWFARDGDSRVLAEEPLVAGGRSYWGDSHARLVADFYAHLAAGTPFWIDPREALMSLRVLRRVYEISGLVPPGAG